jgi:NADPH:quinone reductase-like Zn-dependent oxidoreductase
MKATVFAKYGTQKDVLKVKEIEKPTPKDNAVLVKINFAALCWADGVIVTGEV